MPNSVIKSFAKKYGHSKEHVEKLWNSLKKEYGENYKAIVGSLEKILEKSKASDSNREMTAFGHMKVKDCVLTAESVDEYLGSELPKMPEIDADKIYRVYRPAAELKKAIESYNDVPLTNEHFFVDELQANRNKWLGTTSGKAKIIDGKVVNNVVVWSKDGVDLVEKVKQGLSAGYAYNLVKESGNFNGKPYDFKMTDIVCNHVALVGNPRVKVAKLADNFNNNLLEVLQNMNKKELLQIIADEAPDLARKLLARVADESHVEKSGRGSSTDKEELSDEELKELEGVVHAKKEGKDKKKMKDKKKARDEDDLVEDEEEEEKEEKKEEKHEERKKAEDAMNKKIADSVAEQVAKQLREIRETQELCEGVIGKAKFAADSSPEDMINTTLKNLGINHKDYSLETKIALLKHRAKDSKQVVTRPVLADSHYASSSKFDMIEGL